MRKLLMLSFTLGSLSAFEISAQTTNSTELTDSIRTKLEILNQKSSFDLKKAISEYNSLSVFPRVDDNTVGAMEFPVLNTTPGEFGYVIRDMSSGSVIDILNSDAPVFDDGSELTIKGYQVPSNSELTLAAGADWSQSKQDYLKGITEEARKSFGGRSIDEVAKKAQEATLAWAARLCPTYVYPTKVTLFLNAGFDFVVIDSKTGSEIEIVMSDACAGLNQLLTVEAEKQGIQLD
jgi:hypothetical protein